MTRARVRGGMAALASVGVFGWLVLVMGPAPKGTSEAPADPTPQRARPPGKPILMATDLVGLEITLGLKEQKRTPWDGEIRVSDGKVLSVDVVRGAADSRVDGNRFFVHTFRQGPMQQVFTAPVIRVTLESPATATVTVETKQGKFTLVPADLPEEKPQMFLEGRASVERQAAPVRLTGCETEDDFPVLARGADGVIWLAYVEYQPGRPIIPERLAAGDFETLVPTGHGDQVRLVRFDGRVWEPAIDVTDPGLDVWRPTVAVDGKGVVWVVWSQQVDGDWEVFHRRYTPPGRDNPRGQLSEIVRLTNAPGADVNAVAATDSTGTVWLAWQAWRNDNFEIMLAALADGHPWRTPRVISNSKANDWSPAIAADKRGNVYVAWDTYDKGNYDVRLYAAGKEPWTIEVANSARFEARPSLVCDGQDRLWIAYEEGDEQWGKDFCGDHFQKIPLPSNPGFPLYRDRTVRVKCLVDRWLVEPAGDLQQAFGKRLPFGKSVPRLAVDGDGGLWLFLRHHPLPTRAGEVWDSFALRYQGKEWSAPRRLPASANLLDNRPALAPFGKGLLAVYSGDNRIRTANRGQDDLFAVVFAPAAQTVAPEFTALPPPSTAAVPTVHPHEERDVARLRGYRFEVGGKPHRVVRGEFHRHTEFTAHRDQDGLLEDSWRYALDAGNLDWMGNGDHDNGFGSEYMWWLIQKTTDVYHHPPRFVAAQSYERSVVYPDGHRNVIMPRRGIRPLPRGDLKGTPEKGTPDVKQLYACLKHFGGICSSHTSATDMGTDWRDNDPGVEPVVEIYQGHRHNYEHFGAPRAPTQPTNIGGYRPAGFVWNALERGYRLGFQSSSDHVSTHMSYGMVIVEENSRKGIIDAFKKRHSYAATDNIVLDVRSGDHLMGDEFETAQRPTLKITVLGTAPIAKLHVIRDNKYVYSTEPKSAEVKGLEYTDMDAQPGKTSYYYVRVEQADGNLGWASPMWITYKPK